MMTATSTEQSTESSWAFLNRPPLRFRKVLQQVSFSCGDSNLTRMREAYTERFRSSLMALISIFLRPIVTVCGCVQTGMRMDGWMDDAGGARWVWLETTEDKGKCSRRR